MSSRIRRWVAGGVPCGGALTIVVWCGLCRRDDDDRHWWHVSDPGLDEVGCTADNSSSTAAMGKGVTEAQFVDDKTKKALAKM